MCVCVSIYILFLCRSRKSLVHLFPISFRLLSSSFPCSQCFVHILSQLLQLRNFAFLPFPSVLPIVILFRLNMDMIARSPRPALPILLVCVCVCACGYERERERVCVRVCGPFNTVRLPSSFFFYSQFLSSI